MINDLRFAIRTIAAHRWFSLAVALTLALGIGINTTVFTLVNAVLFKPVALPGGERLMVVMGQNVTETNSRFGVSYPDYREFRANAKSFEALEAIRQGQAIVSEPAIPPARYRMGLVSQGMFEMVRTPPVIGRPFAAADCEPGAPAVAMLSYRVWWNRYGGQRDAVGRVVRINGQPVTIAGAMPAGFQFPSGQEIWMPLQPTGEMEQRSSRPLQLIGVLRPGVSQSEAATELGVTAKRLESAFSGTNKNIGVSVNTFHQAFNGGNIRTVFLLMLGAVGFVLLIACANVANMMLARSLARRRELSVRAAMGASRWQLIRQFLIESVTLSLLGGIAGLALSRIGIRYFDRATLEVRPYWIEFTMDHWAFAYFAAISVFSGVLFGLLPALRASRVDLANELKEGTRTAGSVRGGRLSGGLVVLQFALTVVLLAGAGLMVRSFLASQRINGFVPEAKIFTARVSVPDRRGEPYAEREKKMRFFEDLRTKLAALPGITHAALSSNLPGSGSASGRIEIEGKPAGNAAQGIRASFVVHTPGFLELIDLPMREGRGFGPLDGETGREAAIATREFAERYWPNESAIGRRFRFLDTGPGDKPGPWMAVVGISENLVQNPMSTESHPLVFVPHRQEGWGGMFVMLRGPAPSTLARPVQTAVQELDQDVPASEVFTLEEAAGKQRWMIVVFGALFFSFAAIGLLIASVGIYAVVAQAAARRTREIGIRMALGATVGRIVGLMLGRGAVQLGVGLAIGLAGALAVTRLMRGFLIRGVSPQDPLVFVLVPLVLVATGLFACWLPARRAAGLHPVEALREE